jgi:hypothetical protein
MRTLGDFQRLGLIRQNHEGRPEDDDVELRVRFFLFQVVEVHVFDLHVGVVFEQLLAGRNVVLVVVDAQHASPAEAVDYRMERSARGSADIQHVLEVRLAPVAFAYLLVGDSE